MRLLYDYWPRDSLDLHHQTELSDISQKDFNATFEPKPLTRFQRHAQWVTFFLFFGWLRIILWFVFNVFFLTIFYILIAILPLYHGVVHLGRRVGQLYGRALLFCYGIYWIRVQGQIDDATRQITYNHTTIMDGIMIFYEKIFTIVLMAGVRNTPIFGRLMTAAESIFIERTQVQGASGQISDGIRNHAIPPIAIAPEGKLSNGDIVFRFRTGGFLTDEQIQPIALRYYRILPWVGTTLSWFVPSFWQYMFGVFCSPGYIGEITILPPFTTEQLKGKEPVERADMTQLAIANYLGTLAINQTTKAFFQGAEKQKDE
jgi:1-acyl-sn-glycerol-3-phosphate acyltransferase